MALASKLFRGDRALEACAVEDSAHVTQGAIGDHVSKIHTALFVLDGVSVVSAELQTGRYGSSTANAVLAYKSKRAIINRTYQSHADNIVGKMTIAEMDAEMVVAENRRGPPVQRRELGWNTRSK